MVWLAAVAARLVVMGTSKSATSDVSSSLIARCREVSVCASAESTTSSVDAYRAALWQFRRGIEQGYAMGVAYPGPRNQLGARGCLASGHKQSASNFKRYVG